MMGLLSASSRVDVLIDHEPGSLKNAIHLINEAGGDIINIAMAGQQSGHRTYYFRLTACDTSAIRAALENDGYHVLDTMD
jgi:acetoin utilization protein AcuB